LQNTALVILTILRDTTHRKSILQKRAACARQMQFKGLGFPNKHFELGFEKSDSKIASWYQLALLAANANAF